MFKRWGPALKYLYYGRFNRVMWLYAGVLILMLVGCRHTVVEPAVLPYKMVGSHDPTMMRMQAKFNNEGIRVVSVGQDYMVSIPSSVLFANDSPRLMWKSYAPLNAIVCYLKQFRKVAITVTAFTDSCGSPKRDYALTLARARVVGDYLWSQGIDSRFIFTEGLGSDKPIIGYTKMGDKSQNSRIEITFRDMVA